MGVLVPKEVLDECPLPNAVVVVSLEEASETGGKIQLPDGAIRLAVSIKVLCCAGECLIGARKPPESASFVADFIYYVACANHHLAGKAMYPH